MTACLSNWADRPKLNVTMETEIPTVFRAREKYYDDRFSFKSNTDEAGDQGGLAAMDRGDRCALELSDAAVDVLGYAVWLPSCQWERLPSRKSI